MNNITDKKESEKSTKETSRRDLLKKAVYAAPTVLVLGSLMRPTNAKAAFGDPEEGAFFLG